MARRDDNLQARIDRDLALLKLPEIAKSYREVLDEAARKGSSFLEVLAILFGLERAALLFQVVAARLEVGSIVITTNRPFREWGKILDVDNTLATALIDRLMHHGEAIVIQGDSYRMKDKNADPTEG